MSTSPAETVFYVARGIEDHHYWVVQEFDGGLVETPWRVESEFGGYRLSHADDNSLTDTVFALGAFTSPEAAVQALQTHLGH